MSERVFDRETLLDLAVNAIPLGIILFFVVLFALVDPFGNDVVAVVLSQGLLVVPFVVLAVVTYYAGRIIAESEHTGHSETAAAITRLTTGDPPTGDSGDEDDGDGEGADGE